MYYDAQQFLLKNKDTLAQDIVELLSASSNPLVRELFREDYGAAAGERSLGLQPFPLITRLRLD